MVYLIIKIFLVYMRVCVIQYMYVCVHENESTVSVDEYEKHSPGEIRLHCVFITSGRSCCAF